MDNRQTFVNNQKQLKVVILEDGKYERAGMLAELSEDDNITVIGTAAQPEAILSLVESDQPDVAFIDLRIYGDMNVGASTIRQIKAMRPETKCVVLTGFVDLPNFLAAFDAGAEGFIRKDARPDQQPTLYELVRIVCAGGRYYDPQIVGEMRHLLDPSMVKSKAIEVEFLENNLTDKELQVLNALAQKRSNAEIAAELVITHNTVKSHLRNIYAKLGVNDRHEAVLIAAGRGLLNGETPLAA